MAASRQVYRLHTGIRGELPHPVGAHPRGEHYEANEMQALCWVFATLVESAILAYEFVMPPLSLQEREDYYAESKRMAALFGIPPAALPPDWTAFLRYTAAMFESQHLGVDENARAMGHGVLSGVGTWIRPPQWYRALTAFWMPPRLRVAFELPYGAEDEEAVKWAANHLHVFYPRVPGLLRLVGPFTRPRHDCAASSGTAHARQQSLLDGSAPPALFPIGGMILDCYSNLPVGV